MSINEEKKILERFQQECVGYLEKSKALGENLAAAKENHTQEVQQALAALISLLEEQMVPALHHYLHPPLETHSTGKSGHRVIPRKNLRLPVQYGPAGERTMLRGFSRDVGAMGLFILANRMEKVGHKLQIEIQVPDIGPILLKGTVVWTKWVPPSLRCVEYTGFGVRITQAPEQWFSFFADQAS